MNTHNQRTIRNYPLRKVCNRYAETASLIPRPPNFLSAKIINLHTAMRIHAHMHAWGETAWGKRSKCQS